VQYWWLFPFNDATKWDGAIGTIDWLPHLGNLKDVGDHAGDWVWVDVLLDLNELPQFAIYHHHGDSHIVPSVVPWEEVEKEDGRPRAYVEMGVHELWPHKGPAGPKTDPIHAHQGDGLRLWPKTVLNLGEAGHPIRQGNDAAQLDAELVLLFNGVWGDFAGAGAGGNPSGPVQQFFPRP
jgi:hypothetical protein